MLGEQLSLNALPLQGSGRKDLPRPLLDSGFSPLTYRPPQPQQGIPARLQPQGGPHMLLIVAGNAPAARLLALYRKRWKIECLFRHLKSKGFRLENTHMVLHDHLERLLCLLTLAFLWNVLIGVEEPARIKGHGRTAWSAFTLGLRRLIQAFSRAGSGVPGMLLALITRAFASLRTGALPGPVILSGA